MQLQFAGSINAQSNEFFVSSGSIIFKVVVIFSKLAVLRQLRGWSAQVFADHFICRRRRMEGSRTAAAIDDIG
jgi:hypothetical protein